MTKAQDGGLTRTAAGVGALGLLLWEDLLFPRTRRCKYPIKWCVVAVQELGRMHVGRYDWLLYHTRLQDRHIFPWSLIAGTLFLWLIGSAFASMFHPSHSHSKSQAVLLDSRCFNSSSMPHKAMVKVWVISLMTRLGCCAKPSSRSNWTRLA